MLTNDDIQKLKDIFATKEDVPAIREDNTPLERTINEIAETVNPHTLMLNELASKHALETMLEKSLPLTLLKAEHELMKKHMREKLRVEI